MLLIACQREADIMEIGPAQIHAFAKKKRSDKWLVGLVLVLVNLNGSFKSKKKRRKEKFYVCIFFFASSEMRAIVSLSRFFENEKKNQIIF